jgi:hypothetical protein
MSLKDVHPEHTFKLKNGAVIKNLYELANELATMDEETFRHHVNDEKNDFHNWVQHIVRDEHLANVFSEIRDRRLMLAAVEKRINDLENPSTPLHKLPFHITATEYLLGIIVGAIAMLMITRLL